MGGGSGAERLLPVPRIGVMEWALCSAWRLVTALRTGEVTSVELTDGAIARIERDRPLLGIPVTVKESYNMAGLPTTWGMPQYANYLPAEDAVVVARLKAAGAVILGKTNVPFMLQDWQSFNDLYGTTNNPWDHGRTPGGSSGGSAAALASGFGALSVGSDLAGSLRVPAHFCGIYAHKPSFGLVPTRGMAPPPVPALPIEGDLGVCGPPPLPAGGDLADVGLDPRGTFPWVVARSA